MSRKWKINEVEQGIINIHVLHCVEFSVLNSVTLISVTNLLQNKTNNKLYLFIHRSIMYINITFMFLLSSKMRVEFSYIVE